MPKIEFEQDRLDAMVAEVATALREELEVEQSALAKSAPGDEPDETSEGSSGPSAPPKEGSAPEGGPEASASGPPAPEASAPMAPEGTPPPGPEASAAPEGSAAPDGGAIQPAPSVEELQAEYAKLPPDALKMHFLAAKSALMAVLGAEQSAAPGPEASAPGAGAPPPGAAPAGPPPGAAPMAMAERKAKEVKLSDGNGGEVKAGKMGKSEKDVEIEALRKQLDDQNKALLQLAEVVATPMRKSIKGLSDLKFIERTEEPKAQAQLTKKEVQAKLSEKIREGKLSKSDKELIAKWSVGAVDVSKIEHLLANAK